MKEWIDEQTGHTVRQITENIKGTRLSYFRLPKRIPGGLMMTYSEHATGNIIVFEPESGQVDELPLTVGGYLKLRESDGRLWYTLPNRQIWHVDLPGGEPVFDVEIPENIPGSPNDITCDGNTVILNENTSDFAMYKAPHSLDIGEFWKYFHERTRDGRLYAFNVQSKQVTQLLDWQGEAANHIDTSPVDPGLVKFCGDHIEFETQRIWSARTDGSDLHKIRPTEKGEMITHEFWSHNAQLIGYTYQDRRGDPTCYVLPWAEYSPMETQIGFSNLKGEEVYLSDPVNHHHSHVMTSPDGKWITGEGTENHNFVYLASLSLDKTRIRYFPMATIHTAYTPLAGQSVDAGFTADSRWMVYTDTIQEISQVCTVRVDE